MAQVQETVAAYFAAIRSMDGDGFVNSFAEDATAEDPVGAPPSRGHEAIRAFFNGITAAFDQVGLTEDNVFICGNTAAVKWTGRGTGKNGQAVTFEGIDVIEVNADGKIQTLRAYWDPRAMMKQLR